MRDVLKILNKNLYLLTLILSACAAVPDADKIIQEAEGQGKTQIVGAKGPLSSAEIHKILNDIDISDAFQRHLAIEQALTLTPLISDNSTRVLRDGEETFSSMFAAMKSAKDHINLEYFILEDIENDGVLLSDLLIKKQSQGVAVNIIYDGFGSSSTPPEFFERLKKAGVKIVHFNPLNPLETRSGYSPNERDHRKILLVDGKIAITGGVNLSKSYLPQVGKSAGPPDGPHVEWRDTDLEIKGPAVAALEDLFVQQWQDQNGPPLNQGKFFPKATDKGSEIIRIIGSSPEEEIPCYYITLLSAIRSSEKNVWLASAYFVPTDEEVEDLIDAAERGVDVRILVPDKSDSDLSIMLQRSHYDDLLKAGVKIYETQNLFLHSKTAVIDGAWSVIGSSNLDHRSVIFNHEIDVVVLGEKTGQELERIFEDDFSRAGKIDAEKWDDRPLTQKLKGTVHPLWLSFVEKYL